jgi:predicted Zn-dependent peptidase
VPEMETLIKKIEAVTVEQVRDLAKEIFKSAPPSLSAVGQLSALENHAALAARFA